MATLIHEIWVEYDENGSALPGVCLAGPDGDGFRKLLPPTARCVRTFEAASLFDAMTIYYRIQGWGAYTTEFAIEREPYSEEWVQRQRGES